MEFEAGGNRMHFFECRLNSHDVIGPLELKALRKYCTQLNDENRGLSKYPSKKIYLQVLEYLEAIGQLQAKINTTNFDKKQLKDILDQKVDTIARLKQKALKDDLIQRSM